MFPTKTQIVVMIQSLYSVLCGINPVVDSLAILPMIFPSEISLHCYGSRNSMEFLSRVDA